MDENLWGRSVEAGELEDPWLEPPELAYAWTTPVSAAPDDPAYLEVHFEEGVPTGVDGEKMAGPDLVRHLNALAGSHGIGRIDHVENRLVGIKSERSYEAPAAVVLHTAHQALEAMDLEQGAGPDQDLHRPGVRRRGVQWSLVHAPSQDLDAYVRSTQRHVTGLVRLRLHKGTSVVVGRSAPRSLYQHDLATYDLGASSTSRCSRVYIHLRSPGAHPERSPVPVITPGICSRDAAGRRLRPPR